MCISIYNYAYHTDPNLKDEEHMPCQAVRRVQMDSDGRSCSRAICCCSRAWTSRFLSRETYPNCHVESTSPLYGTYTQCMEIAQRTFWRNPNRVAVPWALAKSHVTSDVLVTCCDAWPPCVATMYQPELSWQLCAKSRVSMTGPVPLCAKYNEIHLSL